MQRLENIYLFFKSFDHGPILDNNWRKISGIKLNYNIFVYNKLKYVEALEHIKCGKTRAFSEFARKTSKMSYMHTCCLSGSNR